MAASLGRYDIGDLVKLVATYTSTDYITPADATTVYFVVKSPATTAATYVFTAGAGGSITRVGVGAYRKDVTPDVYGRWYYRTLGTGGVQNSEKWYFDVEDETFFL